MKILIKLWKRFVKHANRPMRRDPFCLPSSTCPECGYNKHSGWQGGPL